MSHHLDSALSRQDTRLNITDLYVFRGRIGTVLVLDVNTSAAGPASPQGFHPDARYEFKIDVDGDAIEELTFRVSFGVSDADGRQTLELDTLSGSAARKDGIAGERIARGLTGVEAVGVGNVRIWAGRATEPFYIDGGVLRALGTAFKNGTRVDLSRWDSSTAANLFQGTDVYAIVLEIPDAHLYGLLEQSRSIGVWGLTKLATDDGGWRQINRAGRPMIQPIFNPDGVEVASAYNTTQPADDRRNYAERFTKLVAAVVNAQGTADNPRAYAESVISRLLPDVLPYEVGTPANYGFAAHNGRALSDNTPEVMFSLVTNSALTVGLDRHSASGPGRDDFPYVAAHMFDNCALPAGTRSSGAA